MQVVHRNKEPHSGGTMWSKKTTTESMATSTQKRLNAASSGPLLDKEREELQQLRDESNALRTTLEQVGHAAIILYTLVWWCYLILRCF